MSRTRVTTSIVRLSDAGEGAGVGVRSPIHDFVVENIAEDSKQNDHDARGTMEPPVLRQAISAWSQPHPRN